MIKDPKQKPEVEQLPQSEQERPIPPDYIPEPKKHEEIFEK
jgi:hypothetical protein